MKISPLFFYSFFTHCLLINAAFNPPPKPLSMFTTETFGAQLFNMVRRAEIPWRFAPYPTDVGTAITGQAAKPATTEGSAPSIPATATITLALNNFSL